jgi:hypothetical protein
VWRERFSRIAQSAAKFAGRLHIVVLVIVS